MKMNKKTLKLILIFVIILAGVGILCFALLHLKKDKEYNYLRKYDANEYIPTYVTYEDLAKIYLNDYFYYMRFDQKKAYDLLDKKYKEKKFGSFNEFSNYIKDLRNSNLKMKRYVKYTKNKYVIYKIYDRNGNVFIFKTNGIMQYKVYLDEKTVEIGE